MNSTVVVAGAATITFTVAGIVAFAFRKQPKSPARASQAAVTSARTLRCLG